MTGDPKRVTCHRRAFAHFAWPLYLGDLHSNDFHDNDFLKTLFGVHAQVSYIYIYIYIYIMGYGFCYISNTSLLGLAYFEKIFC